MQRTLREIYEDERLLNGPIRCMHGVYTLMRCDTSATYCHTPESYTKFLASESPYTADPKLLLEFGVWCERHKLFDMVEANPDEWYKKVVV